MAPLWVMDILRYALKVMENSQENLQLLLPDSKLPQLDFTFSEKNVFNQVS